ncbi:hypothetical protein [Cereibacter sphaeroides]|uniref:hypothetical protein n=1 Tax=Cereibacter sphaeroides TaxID=1063 RepID=UPI001F38DA73|nr:hypothetical protein [Cereibacter sphaeroides]MCE6968049.1 hypothetical protein [Cereibacter sphaeroides]
MKRIIGGKRYDTDDATLIGEMTSRYSQSDFNYYEEALYLTDNGAYFLAGEGGPRSKYAVQFDRTYSSGSSIIPLSKQEAFEWAQENLTPEEVESEFSADIQDA